MSFSNSSMTVLLTGGSGMVGKNLQEHPQFQAFRTDAPTHSELDLLDYQSVLNYLTEKQPDIVIHAAGRVGGIHANMTAPLDYFTDNLLMTQNIILAAKAAGITRFLNLASSCMYPRNITSALTEDMILKGELEPTNEGFALAKIVGTRMCQYISASSPRFQYKTLISCNLYGRWDKFDPEQAHMIPAVIRKIHQAICEEQPKVEIWGDGTPRRECMYTADLADFMVQALHHFDALPLLTNVGVGQDHTIDDYYHTIAIVLGFKGHFTHNVTRPGGMQQKLLSNERAKALGWQPKTSLEEGIRKTYQFYLETHAEHSQNNRLVLKR